MIGRTVSHYQILEKLGAGGMGEVYLAKDTSLDRKVALKFLPASLAHDEVAHKRFLREAQSAAALDHPFICSIHEISQTEENQDFICMQYVEGLTLLEKLAKGPLPLREALPISVEIAQALEKAHSSGIIHRDLKPANIMLTGDGHPKVMDFGLAKKVVTEDGREEDLTSALTRQGSTVGTLAYMSPEQVKAQPVDHRSDLFSFGIVLHEMLTGVHPFRKAGQAETLAAILDQPPPPLSRCMEEVPELLEHILRKLLAKDPDERYQSIHEVRTDLISLGSAPSVTQPGVSVGRRRFSSGWPAVMVLAGALAATLSWVYLRTPASTPPPSAVETEFRQVTFLGNVGQAQLSPDGHFLAYSTGDKNETSLWVQDLAGGRALELFKAQAVHAVRWSPDNSQLLFSGRDSGGQSFTALIPRLGGEIQTMPRLPYVAWSPDGERFAGTFQNKSPIQIVNVSSGEVEREITVEGDYFFVAGIDWSSQGHWLLLNTKSQYHQGLWLVSPDDSRQKQVYTSKAVNFARWSGTGQDIYFLGANPASLNPVGDLWKLALQGESTSSDPVRLVTGREMSGPLSVSENGETLAYIRKQEWGHYWVGNLQAGKMKDVRQLTKGNLRRLWGSLSPGGESLAYSQSDPTRQALNLFVMSIEGGDPRQLTFLDCDAHSPAWSPDGRWIAFSSDCAGEPQVWRVPVGGGPARPFLKTEVGQLTLYWAPSREILYTRPGSRNFHILDPETEEESPLVEDESVGWMFDAQPSPDGKKVAVFWNRRDGAADGIYVISRQDGSASLLSKVDGFPRGWSPDGNWIYASEYAAAGNSEVSWIRVSVSDGAVEQLATPPEGSLLAGITLDTKRALYLTRESQSDVWLAGNFDPEVALPADK